ncbi:MAG TPA: ABC transporter ATP-binding protein [Pirellulales bacterium]|nr:ABC transporter ATP-binding protein [Pirellulales bacterium]
MATNLHHDRPIGPEPCPHGSLAEHRAGSDAVCLDGVSFSYPSTRGSADRSLALRDVTLHVEQGCSLGIIGPNGAGKTTLLKIILGLLEGFRGTVRVLGMTPREACRRGGLIGYVPQRHDAEWRFPLTVRQVVRMGLIGKTGPLQWYSRADRQHVELLMEQLGIAPLADRPIGDLSGGQQQRCFIARALAAKPKILILDEPLVGVDEAGQQQFAELSRRLHNGLNPAAKGPRAATGDGGSSSTDSKLTLVIVSHDIRAIAASCSRVACLNQMIHYHDSPAGLTEDVLREVFQHEISSVLRAPKTPPHDSLPSMHDLQDSLPKPPADQTAKENIVGRK